MRHHKKIIAFFWVLILVCFLSTPARALDGFTQKDRELLITLKVKVEEIDKRFEQVDKRFEQIDKRFEQFGKQIDQLFNFLWIFAVIFTSITVTTIGFAIWDRRSMIRPFEIMSRTAVSAVV